MKTGVARSLLVSALLLVTLLATADGAAAHNSGPARVEQLQIGAYRFTMECYAWPPHVAEPVPVTLLMTDPPDVPRSAYRVVATASAGPSLHEADIKVTVHPDPDDPRRLALEPTMPAKGNWLLKLQVSGPRGEALAIVPWSVEGPPAIPPWLGWAVGLIPLWGFLIFAVGEYRRFRSIQSNLFLAPGNRLGPVSTSIPEKDP